MKILHTADWHLGAKTEGKSRLEEQRQIMNEICTIAESENVDIVLIAGDIFDQAVPTSSAEDLFYETLDKLTHGSERVVIAIAGNHDDPKRLTAGVHFAKKHNAIIVGNLAPKIEEKKGKRISVTSTSNGSICVKVNTSRGVQQCNIATLPYPAEYRIEEKVSAETYAGKVEQWARMVAKGFKKEGVNILVTHLMLVGGTMANNGEEKVIKVGDINAVGKGDLPKADYYALGHLHSYQNLKGNYCYSGAPIYLDVDQRTAGVVIVEATNSGVKNIKFKEINCAHKIAEVEVREGDNVEELLKNFSPEDIVNVTFIQSEPLKSEMVKSLKSNFMCVRQVKLNRLNLQKDDVNYVCNRTKLDNETLFNNFYKSKKFALPKDDVVALFKELMEDKTSETN